MAELSRLMSVLQKHKFQTCKVTTAMCQQKTKTTENATILKATQRQCQKEKYRKHNSVKAQSPSPLHINLIKIINNNIKEINLMNAHCHQ